MRVIAWGNFGARPKPPNRPSNWSRRLATACSRMADDSAPPAPRLADRGALLDGLPELLGLLVELAPAGVPGVVDGVEEAHEAGHALPVVGREVGAAEERAAAGVEEHGHGPAAAAGHGLDGLHVDGVDVGPFLAIDLDVDEAVVHHRGDGLVLERLVRHHVAPVARRVADGEQDRLVLGARPGERLLAPRVPVDRVVGVLAQVRAGLVLEPVAGSHAVQGNRERYSERAFMFPSPEDRRAGPGQLHRRDGGAHAGAGDAPRRRTATVRRSLRRALHPGSAPVPGAVVAAPGGRDRPRPGSTTGSPGRGRALGGGPHPLHRRRGHRCGRPWSNSWCCSAPGSTRARTGCPPAWRVSRPTRSITRRPRRGRSRSWPVRASTPVGSSTCPSTSSTTDCDRELLGAGFDPSRPAVFVWEGVTNYLTADAVDDTLGVVRDLAAPGSAILFTYVHAGVLDGDARSSRKRNGGCSSVQQRR